MTHPIALSPRSSPGPGASRGLAGRRNVARLKGPPHARERFATGLESVSAISARIWARLQARDLSLTRFTMPDRPLSHPQRMAMRKLAALMERVAFAAAPGSTVELSVAIADDIVHASVLYVRTATAGQAGCQPVHELWSWPVEQTMERERNVCGARSHTALRSHMN